MHSDEILGCGHVGCNGLINPGLAVYHMTRALRPEAAPYRLVTPVDVCVAHGKELIESQDTFVVTHVERITYSPAAFAERLLIMLVIRPGIYSPERVASMVKVDQTTDRETYESVVEMIRDGMKELLIREDVVEARTNGGAFAIALPESADGADGEVNPRVLAARFQAQAEIDEIRREAQAKQPEVAERLGHLWSQVGMRFGTRAGVARPQTPRNATNANDPRDPSGWLR